MSKTNPKTLKVRSVVPGTGEQLAKVKKLITANNADSFALAVELVRTLELDNEASWLALLGKTRIVQLVKLHDNRVTPSRMQRPPPRNKPSSSRRNSARDTRRFET